MLAIKSAFARKEDKTSIALMRLILAFQVAASSHRSEKFIRLESHGGFGYQSPSQVIAIADYQFFISGKAIMRRLSLVFVSLTPEERVQEIAKMLAGDNDGGYLKPSKSLVEVDDSF